MSSSRDSNKSDIASGESQLSSGLAADALFGDVSDSNLTGNVSSDSLIGGEGDDHLWTGELVSGDPQDVFVKQTGTGTDYVHDFQVQADVVDLSAYNMTFQDVQDAMHDVGWATQIELTGFSGIVDDRIYLKNVEPDQLDESNFAL